jgi:DNA replication protein DnaC
MLPVPDLLDHLRGAFSPEAGQSYDERFEQMKRADLLVLDDYGAQNETPWATEKLFQLLNHRYNANRSTVITSNNMGLVGIDPRIRSRLSDRELVTVVRMEEARDYRVYGDSEE